jgi:hypothetical protein
VIPEVRGGDARTILKPCHLGDLRDGLLDKVVAELRHFAVPLMLNDDFIGSGALVQIDVLTATRTRKMGPIYTLFGLKRSIIVLSRFPLAQDVIVPGLSLAVETWISRRMLTVSQDTPQSCWRAG